VRGLVVRLSYTSDRDDGSGTVLASYVEEVPKGNPKWWLLVRRTNRTMIVWDAESCEVVDQYVGSP
jgi:hypothetical protein